MSFLTRLPVRSLSTFQRYYSTSTGSLLDRLKDDRKTFMKAKKQPDLNVVKGLLSDFTYFTKSANFIEGTSDNDALLSVLQKAIKRRQDSVSQFETGGRPELAEQERMELSVLQSYLPAQMSADEIELEVAKVIQEVGATTAKDMGKVMKAWKLDAATADRKLVSETVKRLLN
ncbi:Yqey-like protein-domain-containing protein [Pilobolus umbonatus]|nr:Yqey-like protein-domain-containing protein [Pilobolus umbonatus]